MSTLPLVSDPALILPKPCLCAEHTDRTLMMVGAIVVAKGGIEPPTQGFSVFSQVFVV